MKCYQYIEYEHHEIISKKLYEYIVNKTNILNLRETWTTANLLEILNHVPEFDDFFIKYNIIPLKAAIIRVSPDTVDQWPHVDDTKSLRLLWPVINCQGSFTKFFKSDSSKIVTKLTGSGVNYHSFISDSYIEIDRVEVIKPIVINPAIPHQVFLNPNIKEPRITFTIACRGSLEKYMK